MRKTNTTHSLQARTVKPNSCMCKTGFAQKFINLFTNAIIENSYPARLEMKPNPLACSECPDLQNCGLNSSFSQLPTKMLPKWPPRRCSHTSMTVSVAAVMLALRTPLTPSSGTQSQDPTWGTPGCVLQSKACSQVCTWPSTGMPCTGGPRGRQPVILSLGGSLGAACIECSPGRTDSRSCRLPCLLKPCLQAAFQRKMSEEMLIK